MKHHLPITNHAGRPTTSSWTPRYRPPEAPLRTAGSPGRSPDYSECELPGFLYYTVVLSWKNSINMPVSNRFQRITLTLISYEQFSLQTHIFTALLSWTITCFPSKATVCDVKSFRWPDVPDEGHNTKHFCQCLWSFDGKSFDCLPTPFARSTARKLYSTSDVTKQNISENNLLSTC